MTELKVVAVQIRDVLGAREFSLAPGRVTVLSGRNGSGKSTALQAVQAALGGGNLARIARVAAAGDDEEIEPEVVLLLEGQGHESYRVERKGEKIRVRARVGDTAAFEDLGKPQSWLRSLYDPQGANPVTFLTASDKDRALLLLEALPLDYNRAELLREMAMETDSLLAMPTGLHPLEEIGLIRDSVFRTRTGVNRDLKGKAMAGEQTRRNAPAVVPDDHAAEIAKLRQQKDELGRQLVAEQERAAAEEERAITAAQHAHEVAEAGVNAAFKAAAAKLRAAFEQGAAEIRAAAEREIAALKAATEASINARRLQDETVLEEGDRAAAAAMSAAREAREIADEQIHARQAVLVALSATLADLEAQAEHAARARALHAQARQFDDEAAELARESDRLTAALEALDAFRRRLAKDLPIDGLEIEGREIRVHGVPYEQLNTAQRVDIAVRVACLRARGQRLPVVFVDGAEALDHEHFDLLVDRLQAAGVQAFVARVTDEPLTVTTEDAHAAAG
jgi:energy-coupling factor transporter ATP-binding protein EcfA2